MVIVDKTAVTATSYVAAALSRKSRYYANAVFAQRVTNHAIRLSSIMVQRMATHPRVTAVAKKAATAAPLALSLDMERDRKGTQRKKNHKLCGLLPELCAREDFLGAA
jgi:hypothetical protein